MSKVRLYGDTSGFVDLKAPDVASNVTITLPNTTGPFATETYVDGAVAAIPGIGSNVVQGIATNTFSTTSASYVSVSGLSATITPSSASSKILVMGFVAMSFANNFVSSMPHAAPFRGATNLLSPASPSNRQAGLFMFTMANLTNSTSIMYPFGFTVLDSPATTSPTTYEIKVAGGSQTVYVNRTVADTDSSDYVRTSSHIIAIEVAA